MDLRQKLLDGLEKLSLNYSEKTVGLLVDYLLLLIKWNKTYNLTAITNPEKMVSHHLLDSLAIASKIHANTLIDIGTGPGLPGIPLAIVNPEKSFTLVDSNGKKTRFLFEVKLALSLPNVKIEHNRCQAISGEFDAVLSRAFSNLNDMLKVSNHLLFEKGSFWAMKGKYPEQEVDELLPGFELKQVIKLDVPFVDEERHLLQIVRKPH
ncbi:MAG: 16S rRNA (guanine(527)-N(7))-methyltransferase RsmG [Pseudomonadales bacterium]|nr:16S rRNA (guanine(527)-N(7))-methyltransferase RsmG [Pseudomonadales bacterium]